MSNQNLQESNENEEETIEEEESLSDEESIDVVEELRQLSSDFFQKHHSFSFICLEQISSSHSSFFKNLYNFFPQIADPGIDDAFNYQPPEFTIDDVGIENYLRNCKQFAIVPYKRIVDSLKTDILDLHYYKLSLEQFRAFKDSLKFNKSVKRLILQDLWLSPEQVEIISEILVENVNITVLNLQECRIGVKGAEKLQEGIMGTFFLRELNLSFNDLKDDGLRFLKDSLIMNNSIKILNLSRNELTEQSALTIQEIITNNKGIEQLDLSWNYLYNGPSNKLMFKTLVDNKQIKWLSLAFNGISAKIGLIPIMKALRQNDTIEFLDLSNNRIANNCVKILKDAIINSESLIEIKIGNNCYQPEQAQILAKSLLDNKFKLEKLDMENTIFTKSFLKLLDQIRAANKTLIYGFILSNYEIIGPDIDQVLFARCNYLAQKPKKKKLKRNFGHFVLQLPDDFILKQDFYNLVAKSKIKLDTDLVDGLSNNFLVRKTKVDCNRMKMEYLRLYPDTVLPEPKPKKAKKKKKKKAKKV